jgi:hypothetical protein
VDHRTRTGTYDPELDVRPGRPSLLSGESIEDYQRLVANPFLAIFIWLADFALLRESLRRQNLPLFLASAAAVFIPFFLLQFHCLDCGRTGWLLRSRRHVCPPVSARYQNREMRRLRGPNVRTQLFLWLHAVLAALVLFLILRYRR